MKLNILISTSMEPEQYINDAVQASNKFNREFSQRFPEFTCVASIEKILGTASLTVNFFNADDKRKASGSIVRNFPGFMQFSMSLSNNQGKHEPMDKFSIELLSGPSKSIVKKYQLKPFRKITAGTPSLALKKLMDWFDQNSFQLKQLPLSYNDL